MVLSHEDQDTANSHPYWYGRIIGLFHCQVCHIGPQSKSTEIQRIDFLWVRWFGRDMEFRAGWKKRRLHRLGFLCEDDHDPIGFLDPNEIIRGVHLIPAFAHGKDTKHTRPSCLHQDDNDWLLYYVNMYL
jgi:hypothetical protein